MPPVRCAVCLLELKTSSLLRPHLAEEHPDTPCATPYLCPLCDKAYSSASSLKHHRMLHSTQRNKECVCECYFLCLLLSQGSEF